MPCLKSATKLIISTPIGLMQIDGCSNGLHAINRIDSSENNNIINIINVNEAEVVDYCPNIVQHTLNWFCKYFNNQIVESTDLGSLVPICPNIKCSKFALDVYNCLASNIGFGKHCSYSELAILSGHTGASRAVGTAMKNNPLSIIVPCHRVIQKSGNVGKYGGKEDSCKKWLLSYESKVYHGK